MFLAAYFFNIPLVNAEMKPIIFIDDEKVNFINPVKTINGSIMVPMKEIFNKMGVRVTYDKNFHVMLARHVLSDNESYIEIGLANSYPYILISEDDKTRWVNCGNAPTIINGVTYVPVRVISEVLKAHVVWNSKEKRVDVVTSLTKDMNQTSKEFIFKANGELNKEVEKWTQKNGVWTNNIVIETSLTEDVTYIKGETLPGVLIYINNEPVETSPMGFFQEIYSNYDGKKIPVDFIIQARKDGVVMAEKTLENIKKEMDTVIIAKKQESVVYLKIYNEESEVIGTGSGFIGDDRGLVITNYHVVKDAKGVKIHLPNGDSYWADGCLSSDPDADWAFIAFKPEKIIKELELAGDSYRPELGEKIMAIGSPKGLINTVSEGVLSGIRKMKGVTVYQISVPVAEGSSGGPIFNSFGNVIGITQCGMDEANLNFAVPSYLFFSTLARYKSSDRDEW